MRTAAFLVVAGLAAACDRTPPVPRTGLEVSCEVIASDAAPWTGLNEGDLLVGIADYVPAIVVWDEATFGDASSPISIGVSTTEEPAWVEERTGSGEQSCRPGPELVVPVSLTVAIGDSDVTGAVPGTVSVDLDGVVHVDADGPVELSDGWLAQAAVAFDGTADDPIWYYSMADEPWGTGANVSIEGRNYEGHDDVPLWRGQLTE
jgi:hypothetical protein